MPTSIDKPKRRGRGRPRSDPRGPWYERAAKADALRQKRLDALRARRDAADIERPELTADGMIAVSKLIPGYDPWRRSGRWEFVPEFALEAVAWVHDNCYHSDDQWAGQPFILQPWQQAVVANIGGWVDGETGLRRYNECFIYVARKNGKTALTAALIELMMFHLSVPSAQIYGVAAEFDQASLVWRAAKLSIEQNESLYERVKINAGANDRSITLLEDDSVYRVVTSKGRTKHGQNPYVVAVDELHVIEDATLIEAITTSFGSRRERLLIYLTTADWDRPSLCNQKYEYAKRVALASREPDNPDAIVNERFLPIVYEVPCDADWKDEANWPLANPNLGVSVMPEFLREQVKRAVDEPETENGIRRLHFNQRTEQETRAIVMDRWDACVGEIDMDALAKCPCVGAVDAAAKIDLAAWVMEFLLPDGRYCWLPRFFCPAGTIRLREKKDKVPYETWAKAGYITATDGDTIDHDVIRDQIIEDCARFRVGHVAFDDWNAVQLGTQLQKAKIDVVAFPQKAKHFNEPTKAFLALLNAGLWVLPDNPVLRWQAGNLAVTVGVNDDYLPNKRKSGDKIDGIMAGLMAHGLMLKYEPKPNDPLRGMNFA